MLERLVAAEPRVREKPRTERPRGFRSVLGGSVRILAGLLLALRQIEGAV